MKSKKKVIGIVVLLIILIAGTTFAALYFFTDIFKTPEDLFYKYMGKVAKSENEYSYQDLLDELKDLQTKSYKGKATFGIEKIEQKNKSSYLIPNNQSAALGAISNVKINMEANVNPNAKKATYNIGLAYGNNNITDVKFTQDGDLYGVKSDLLDSKYIAVENNNLKDLFKKLGASTASIPDKIETVDIYNLLYVSKENQDKISKTYKDLLKKTISSDKFTKKENVVQKINGVDKNTNIYTLSLTTNDLMNIVKDIVDTLKDDDATLDILVEKFNQIVDLSSMTTNSGNNKFSSSLINSVSNTKITKQQLVTVLNQLSQQLQSTMSRSTMSVTFDINVYVADGETVKIDFSTMGQTLFAMEFYTENEYQNIDMYYMKALTRSYSSYSLSSVQPELVKVMKYTYKMTKNGDEKRIEGSMTNYMEEESTFTFDVTEKGKNEVHGKMGMDINGYSIVYVVDSTIEFTDDVQTDELNSQNAYILNDMTKTEIETLVNKIQTNFSTIANSLGLKTSMPVNTTTTTTSVPTTNSFVTSPFQF